MAGAGVRIVAIKAKVFNPETINSVIRAEIEKFMEFPKGALQRTVQSWRGDKPAWETQVEQASDGLVGLLVFTGSTFGRQKWKWLDQGTSVRYATMTPDFKPKTTPGVFWSGSGAGGLLYVSKQRPRPGIKARNWSEKLVEEFGPAFEQWMDAAVKTAIAKTGHKM